MPGIWDRILIRALLGLDEHARLDPDIHKAFRAIFPDSDDDTAPHPRFQELAGILARAVSRDTSGDELPILKTEISRALERLKILKARHPGATNALLVRAWLASLHQSLAYLKSVIAGLGSPLTAGRELARALGSFTHNGALPYGPLGCQLFGFKINKRKVRDRLLPPRGLRARAHRARLRHDRRQPRCGHRPGRQRLRLGHRMGDPVTIGGIVEAHIPGENPGSRGETVADPALRTPPPAR